MGIHLTCLDTYSNSRHLGSCWNMNDQKQKIEKAFFLKNLLQASDTRLQHFLMSSIIDHSVYLQSYSFKCNIYFIPSNSYGKKNENAKTSTLMTFEWTEGTAAGASNHIPFNPGPIPMDGVLPWLPGLYRTLVCEDCEVNSSYDVTQMGLCQWP